MPKRQTVPPSGTVVRVSAKWGGPAYTGLILSDSQFEMIAQAQGENIDRAPEHYDIPLLRLTDSKPWGLAPDTWDNLIQQLSTSAYDIEEIEAIDASRFLVPFML